MKNLRFAGLRLDAFQFWHPSSIFFSSVLAKLRLRLFVSTNSHEELKKSGHIWDLRFDDEDWDFVLLGCDALYLGNYVPAVWRNLLPPFSRFVTYWKTESWSRYFSLDHFDFHENRRHRSVWMFLQKSDMQRTYVKSLCSERDLCMFHNRLRDLQPFLTLYIRAVAHL
jgi:hypothetical protein